MFTLTSGKTVCLVRSKYRILIQQALYHIFYVFVPSSSRKVLLLESLVESWQCVRTETRAKHCRHLVQGA